MEEARQVGSLNPEHICPGRVTAFLLYPSASGSLLISAGDWFMKRREVWVEAVVQCQEHLLSMH